MAEKTFTNVRLGLKVDTLENWQSSTLALKKGEVAFATAAAEVGTGLTEPVVMMKIGEDGVKTFKDLPWSFYAKASDVIAAAKSEDAMKAFVNGVIADAGIASDEAMQELAGKVTTAEGKITTLEGKMTTAEGKISANEGAIAALQGLVGSTEVSAQIAQAIADLKLADTYEAKGEAAKVQTALDTYKTANDAAVQKNATDIAGEITRAKAAEEANALAISTMKDGTTIDSFADVEAALAGKQATGDYATKAEAQAMADGKDAAIAAAKKAGDDAQAGVDALKEQVGTTPVADQIGAAIEELDLANTYDAKGAAADAETAAKGHADGLNTAMSARVDALEAIDHTHSFVESELNLIKAGDVAKWNAAEQNAKDYAKEYADGLDEVMDGRVAALEAKFGDGEGNVESQIAAAVAAEAKLREDADKALQDQIGEASAEGKAASGLHADIERLEGLVGTTAVADQISTAVAAEKERAEGIEGGLETRLAAVEGDYLKGADKTELEGKITANANAIELLTNGVSAEEVDGVNDLIQYVKDHGTEVTGIKGDIKTNADDIDALEGRMDAAEGAIALKAAQADHEALAGRVTTAEGKITALEGKMTTAEADIDALEAKVGTTPVADQISAITNPMDERIVALEAIDHEHANKTVLDGISAEKVATWDAAVQTVTAGTGLTATKTGTDVAIAFDDSVTFIFDCGTSAE